jgi:hypothetical protein
MSLSAIAMSSPVGSAPGFARFAIFGFTMSGLSP